MKARLLKRLCVEITYTELNSFEVYKDDELISKVVLDVRVENINGNDCIIIPSKFNYEK